MILRTIFNTLRALLKSSLCATQLCIRSDTASYFLNVTVVIIVKIVTVVIFFGNVQAPPQGDQQDRSGVSEEERAEPRRKTSFIEQLGSMLKNIL